MCTYEKNREKQEPLSPLEQRAPRRTTTPLQVETLENARHNAAANELASEADSAAEFFAAATDATRRVAVVTLDWGKPPADVGAFGVDAVVGADLVYCDAVVPLLAGASVSHATVLDVGNYSDSNFAKEWLQTSLGRSAQSSNVRARSQWLSFEHSRSSKSAELETRDRDTSV